MTILAQVSGLTDVDSIHGFLKVADECLKEMRQGDWDEIHRRVPKDKLIEAMWLHLGHPLRYPEIEVEHILDFALWLGENGETVLVL